MKKILAIIFALAMVATFVAAGKPGSIWTTTGSCGDPQDANHYAIGDIVYINGANFAALTSYNWDITGQPGGASCDPSIIVADGSYMTDANGAFCFAAYTVQNDDCGEYKADYSNKFDNYRVDDPQVPEFGVVAAGLAMIGAIAAFALTRKN